MTIRSDFTIVHFSEQLGENHADLNVPWATFVGNQTSVHEFVIDNKPVHAAYMLVQLLAVGIAFHRVVVNNITLEGPSLPRHPSWQTWMVVIKPNILRQGINTLQFKRDARSDDSFVVGDVVINWRETSQ